MDKYQPKKIGDLDYNHHITEILKTIAQKEDFPHLILYGAEARVRKLESELYCHFYTALVFIRQTQR